MTSNEIHSIEIILVISAITVLLRVGPAWLFPPSKPTPKVLIYLSKVMPMAVIGMLIVYCFRNTQFLTYPYGIPEIVAGTITAVTFLLKKSTMLSILFGTVSYMFLIQIVFA